MAPVDEKEVVYQRFRYRSNEKLQSLPAQFINSSEVQYVLWSDVQEKLGRTSYLTNVVGNKQRRVLFEVDKDYRVSEEPLRIAHTNRTYTVVLKSDLSGDDNQNESLHIKNTYKEYKDLHNTLEWCSKSKDRDYFLRVLANIEYLHRQLAQLLDAENNPYSDPPELPQLRPDLQLYKQYTEQVEFMSECYAILRNPTQSLELSAPRLFIVLPDITAWQDSDPATHKFRLYFLCDFKFDKMSTNNSPEEAQSIHLSYHRGYDLDSEQTTEFFEQYGQYTLTVLKMVKDGFSDYQYHIPKVENMPGLNSITSAGHPLSKAAIVDSVDKAIAYLQRHSTTQRRLAPWLNARDTQRLGSFLHHRDSDNKVGGLHLSIQNSSARWLCEHHTYKRLIIPEEYKIAVEGWEIDLSQNRIRKELATFDEAEAFLRDITYIKQLFEVSITLGWKAPPVFLLDHWKEINRSSVKVLHVDGIVNDNDAKTPLGIKSEDVVGLMRMSNDLGLIHLRNYPRTGEQYTCLRGLDGVYYGVLSKLASERPGINWVDLGNVLNLFLQQIQHDEWNVLRALRELSGSISQQKTLDLYAIDFFDGKTGSKWSGEMELAQGAQNARGLRLVGAVLPGVLPEQILGHGTLRHVAVQSSDAANLQQLQKLMRSNRGLKLIKIQILEDEMLPRLAELCVFYNCDPGPVDVVLFEKAKPTEGREFARVSIQKLKGEEEARVIKVEHWDCDCILGVLTRRHVSILDAASKIYPSVLASFTLDVSKLSLRGLANLKEVVQRSSIERLHIHCVRVRDSRKAPVGSVLAALQWTTLKSLVLSGDNIDVWIRLWQDHGQLFENSGRWIMQWPHSPRLMRLEMQGTGVRNDRLSKQSLLALHRLVYCCRPVQLKLDNVVSEDASLLELVEQRMASAQSQVDK
ncbi:hypothetical protein BGZ59_008475 [Podila verticillata]|nr:hypothetical protein BGZ59_008475 [Podila verticillata]KFH66045.1 hypothetical protein MVEG_08146 [Podila verticillata NRRL 6337]